MKKPMIKCLYGTTVSGWTASQLQCYYNKGGGAMDTYQAISLMIGFGMLLVALISYLDKR